TPQKYVVRLKGTAYPPEGAQGLQFPYRVPLAPRLTGSRSFQRGLANPIQVLDRRPEWYASDNGFQSRLAMDRAHKPIVELATATLDGKGGNILDLGCGNGALLRKIHEANPEIVPIGIELDPTRLEHARALHPQFADHFTLGDMFESDALWPSSRRYALAILMPGRLLEAGPERAARLKSRLREHCDHLLVYAYGDWRTRYRDLQGLASEAGGSLLCPDTDPSASLAHVECLPVDPGLVSLHRARGGDRHEH